MPGRSVYVKRSPGGSRLTLRQWRRLDIIEAVDGVSVQESIDRAGQLKVIGRVWVQEYLKRWKNEFDARDENTTPFSKTIQRLVELAWGHEGRPLSPGHNGLKMNQKG